MRKLFVVGAGAAGTAAALAATRAGMRVTVADGGTGASTLATGALDIRSWQDAGAGSLSIERAALEALDKLGNHILPQGGAMLLSTSGIVRPASGHDAALLDVRALAKKRIGVVRCDRPGWDAATLARSWGDNYEPIDAVMLRYVDERALPDADFATRHDDEARLQWLADRLREALALAGSDVAALVLPPSLGVDRARARELSALVGVRCGEPIAAPGGPSGLRFERARDRALSAASIERVPLRIKEVYWQDDAWRIAAEDGSLVVSDAVVLAMGGLIGGGIEYAPSASILAGALPPSARRPFRLAVDAPVTLGASDQELDTPSTLFGPAPESIAWPYTRAGLLERVGVLAEGDGRTASGLFVCGDLRADRPRTWLDAFATGAAAGAAVARGFSATSPSPSPDAAPPIRP